MLFVARRTLVAFVVTQGSLENFSSTYLEHATNYGKVIKTHKSTAKMSIRRLTESQQMAVTLLFEEQHEAYELFTKTDLFNVMFEEERGSKISTETLTRAHARWNEEWCRGGRKEKEVEDEKGHKRHRDFRHMVELRIEDADMRIGMNGPQDSP